MAGPPSAPPGEEPAKYSDRFKQKLVPKADEKPSITSTTDFPALGRGPVQPNLVVMPKPLVSFATKVKQMALAEETTKAQLQAERIRRQQEEHKEQIERELYSSIYSTTKSTRKDDSWDTTTYEDDEWHSGTPEFGAEEFLNQEEDDGWS